MRIGIAQINTRPGDFRATCGRMRAYASMASEQGVDLLVFPAMALTGGEGVRESDLSAYACDLLECLSELADEVACPCLVTVHIGPSELVVPQSILVYQGRLRLLGLPESLAGGTLLPGADPSAGTAGTAGAAGGLPQVAPHSIAVFTVAGERVALAYGIDDLDLIRQGSPDASVIVYLSDEGVCVDDPSTAMGAALGENRFAEDALAVDAWLVGVNGVGMYGEYVYGGSSFVLAPDGRLVVEARDFEEDFVSCQVGWGVQVEDSEVLAPEVFDETLYLWQTLVLGLQDIVEKYVDSDQVVLPLDGTLASSLLAMLASDALGPVRVHALVCAPDEDSAARARGLAARLRLDVRELDAAGLSAGNEGDLSDLRLKSRAAAELAVWAAQLGAQVLSPADKTQLALGLDARVPSSALAMPLGDVYRSDAIDLARLRNTISPVMESVAFTEQDGPPVEGIDLPAGPADERIYAIDSVLLEHLEGCHGVRDVCAVTGRDVRFVESVLRRLDDTEASRCALPLLIATSSATLAYATSPLGLGWRPNSSRDDQDCQNELARIVSDRVRLPKFASKDDADSDGAPIARDAGPDDEDLSEELGEVLSFLSDYLQEGGFDQDQQGLREWLESAQSGGMSGKPSGQMPFWGSPFSEN